MRTNNYPSHTKPCTLTHHPLFLTASDFENASRSLTFSLGESGRELCHEISVIDDEVLEDAETYTVSLTSTDDDVAIAVTTASLIILDETDGMISCV